MKTPVRSRAALRVGPKDPGQSNPATVGSKATISFTSTTTKESGESAIFGGFVNNVLAAVAEQWASSAATLWRYEKGRNILCLEASYRGRRLTDGKAPIPSCQPGRSLKAGPLWQELSSRRLPMTFNVADNRCALLRKVISVAGMQRLLLVPLTDENDTVGLIGIALPAKATELEKSKTVRLFSQQIVAAWKLADLLNGKVHSGICEERKRIARDLHDSLAQSFSSILIQADLAEELVPRSAEQARQHILRARELATEGLTNARRAVFGLRRKSLENCNLAEALERLAAEFSHAGRGLQVEFLPRYPFPAVAPETEAHLLGIAQESLTNILKHSRATSVEIELASHSRYLELNICDNGLGFDVSTAGMTGGLGIRGMQERASLMGGRLRVNSSTGRGTQVRLTVPFEAGNQRKKSA